MDLASEFTPPFRGDGVRSLADRLPACCFCSRRAPCPANVPTVGCPMLSVAGRGEARPRRSFAAHFETRCSARAPARFWLMATRMPKTRCSIPRRTITSSSIPTACSSSARTIRVFPCANGVQNCLQPIQSLRAGSVARSYPASPACSKRYLAMGLHRATRQWTLLHRSWP